MSDFPTSSQQEDNRRPVKAVIALSAIIFVVEAALMYLLHMLFEPHPSENMKAFLVEASIDSFFLIVLILPAIYFLLYRPLVLELKQRTEDVTQRKAAERKLKETAEKYHALFSEANDGIVIMDNATGDIVECNHEFERQTGRSLVELKKMKIWELRSPEKIEAAMAKFHETAVAGFGSSSDLEFQKPDGSLTYIDFSTKVLDIADKRFMQSISRDITDRKQYESEIADREYWLSESQKAAQIGTYDYDIKTGFWKSTSVLDKLFGIDDTYTKDVDGWLNIIHSEHRQMMSEYLTEVIANKTSFDKEYKIKRISDGEERWLYGRGELTIEDDEAVSLIGTIQDITERKAIEGEIKKSLKEKDVLLREVHHRVKNNMQIINSLMSLQSHHVKDSESREILKECQSRIMSMSLVHEQLYMDDNLGLVNVNRYVNNLIRNIENAFGSGSSGCKYNVNIDVSLDIDTLIPCGLILNELITNSFKYGLAGKKDEAINIQMRPLENNMLELIYGDSGKGLPAHVDPRESKGLGLRLVSILIDQLDGEMDVKRSNGTIFHFTFPGKISLSGKS